MTYLSILSCLFLMGCSTYSEGFDCPKGEGMACRSMSQINAAITKKEVPHMMDEEEELDKIYIFYIQFSMLEQESYQSIYKQGMEITTPSPKTPEKQEPPPIKMTAKKHKGLPL